MRLVGNIEWDPMDVRFVCCTKAIAAIKEQCEFARKAKFPADTPVVSICASCGREWERNIVWPEGMQPIHWIKED